ncbi:ubiquitin-protein ligase Anaphase Promoting Complex [Turnera subulata]|uniref:Anaphase-promoting complex subunit 11 n=1 Tax=Turnera subulata TaxID=218843 RepID=A0A9Q0FAC4_9ROSI|nr:ubiquitin-protein ligase Anaphase Promoting Complex [Turnera subulata]
MLLFLVNNVTKFETSNFSDENLDLISFCYVPPICTEWHAVASWTWDAQDETCGICRMAFDGCCPDCKLPGDDCPLIWGACNHAFHLHCILKWVNSQTSQAHCPMCRREWQFKE